LSLPNDFYSKQLPSVVVKAPFVNATGVPELNVIPAFVPKYQLDAGPAWGITCKEYNRKNITSLK
jgi:hypothetical protein